MTMAKWRWTHRIVGFALSTGMALAVLPAVDPRSAASFPAGEEKAEVKIDNFAFTPQTLTVRVGTEITWLNGDDIPHTVVSEDKTFRSRALDSDEKFTFLASKPGTYTYFCSIHPKMTGKLVVE
jgi:plastocyanin